MVSHDELISRQVKKCAVFITTEAGFDEAEIGAIDDLTQILFDYIGTFAEESQELAYLAGRNAFNFVDVISSLEEGALGHSTESLTKYIVENQFQNMDKLLSKDGKVTEQQPLKIGDDRPMPGYIPSFLPKFPNPHTYIHTEVTNESEMTYARAREVLATNKRSVENSLYRYALNTHDNVCLFNVQYQQALEKARSEVEKQDAERQAKRARYGDETTLDDFNVPETETTIVKKIIPDEFFVLKPFFLEDPTLLAISNEQDDEEQPAQKGDGAAVEPSSDDLQDSKFSDTQDEELILSDSDNND
uniref:Transcription initiation factor TFIID subunit 8 n=1 Tax=Panagrolaimus sp. JU765 TaxID=591449 RepID=A0AC34QGK4_9BILA